MRISGATARIILRYGTGILVGLGLLGEGPAQMIASDPEIQFVLDMAIAGGSAWAIEKFYKIAKERGWSL